MASNQESGLGARLQNAQNMVNYLIEFQNYTSSRSEESIAELQALLTTIVQLNELDAQHTERYRMAVDVRQNLFDKNPDAVKKILSSIRGAIDAQYGKTSKQAQLTGEIIRTMRSTKLKKAVVDPSNPNLVTAVSQSELSYGSLTQHFNNLVSTIEQFEAYNPANASLSVPSLKDKGVALSSASGEVASKIQILRGHKDLRENTYNELSDRFQRVKANVKAQYGISSQQYKVVKGMRI